MMGWKNRLYAAYVSSGQARDQSMIGRNDLFYQQIIRKILPENKAVQIVDLACGSGNFVSCLTRAGFKNVTGIDVSPEQIALAKRHGIEHVLCAEMQSFLKSGAQRFDVVLLMDILEHFDKAQLLKVLDQVHGALTEGGMVIIHVPNAEGLFGMKVRYGDLTHENAFTRQSIRQALQTCHFENIRCYEDKPIVHGMKSLVRNVLWRLMTAFPRLLLIVESGARGHILSQNMLVTAKRAST